CKFLHTHTKQYNSHSHEQGLHDARPGPVLGAAPRHGPLFPLNLQAPEQDRLCLQFPEHQRGGAGAPVLLRWSGGAGLSAPLLLCGLLTSLFGSDPHMGSILSPRVCFFLPFPAL
uniref:Uncharacterized protein n=1 Tax=Castor canadensis TaxID=51338 RepID=A0A8C0W5Z5_CASCN